MSKILYLFHDFLNFCGAIPFPDNVPVLRDEEIQNLKFLPKLPSNLEILDCDDFKRLKALPPLPKTLKVLRLKYCDNLEKLSEFPEGLHTLSIWVCPKLKILPKLPQSLKHFSCIECPKLVYNFDFPINSEYISLDNHLLLDKFSLFERDLDYELYERANLFVENKSFQNMFSIYKSFNISIRFKTLSKKVKCFRDEKVKTVLDPFLYPDLLEIVQEYF